MNLISDPKHNKIQEPKSVYGYPIQNAKELGLDAWFKKNKHIAGMAWGGGVNGSAPGGARVLVSNPYYPYNDTPSEPLARLGTYMFEASKHHMAENKYKPKFVLNDAQRKWQKTLGGNSADDAAFKEFIITSLIKNDDVPGVTPEQQAEADAIYAALWAKDKAEGSPVQTYLNSLLAELMAEFED